MKTARQIRRDAKHLWRFCQVQGHLDEKRVLDVAEGLARSPRPGAPKTLQAFVRLVKLDSLLRSARVETALPLTRDARGALEHSLTQRHGPGVQVTFAVDPSLIGGMRITVGSAVYDATVKGGLATIETRFQASTGAP